MGTPIYDTTFVVCDVETTGVSSDYNRITEIGLIKIYNGEVIDKFTSLINPKQHIPSQITYLTGITNEDVMNKPTFEELSPKIHNFIFDKSHATEGADSTLLFTGHNVAFDYNFIRKSGSGSVSFIHHSYSASSWQSSLNSLLLSSIHFIQSLHSYSR